MIKTFKLLVFLLISVTTFPQNKCFDEYEITDIPQNVTDIRAAFEDRFLQFKEVIKNCKAPDFKAATINGDTIELKKLRGKVVVINFWFIGCAPCIAEIPALNKLAEEYESEDVVFIAFSENTKKAILDEFLPKYTFNSEQYLIAKI